MTDPTEMKKLTDEERLGLRPDMTDEELRQFEVFWAVRHTPAHLPILFFKHAAYMAGKLEGVETARELMEKRRYELNVAILEMNERMLKAEARVAELEQQLAALK